MPPDNNARQQMRKYCSCAAAIFVNVIVTAAILAVTPLVDKIPYHTSILSGKGWVQELITGHPERMKTELGMRPHVFFLLIKELYGAGMRRSKFFSLEEQLAIFLYMSVTGLSIRHVAEWFQHANDTISMYVLSANFYSP
jgi:hypothetical protein